MNLTDVAWLSLGYMSVKLLVAGVLGGVVGYERESHGHPGLRTHILVCLGATLITLVSVSFSDSPSRIAAQIVSGIGFLGVGTILRQGNIVRGLTTAASLWTVAGIGMAVGTGGACLWLGVIATIIVYLTLSVLKRLEPAMGKLEMHSFSMTIPSGRSQTLSRVLQSLLDVGAVVESISSSALEGKTSFQVSVGIPYTVSGEQVATILTNVQGMDQFDWT